MAGIESPHGLIDEIYKNKNKENRIRSLEDKATELSSETGTIDRLSFMGN
jgi:hypothetical protein